MRTLYCSSHASRSAGLLTTEAVGVDNPEPDNPGIYHEGVCSMTQRGWLTTGSLVTGACVLFAATAMAQAPNAAPPPPPSVKVGQPAPDFTASYLKRENG